MNTSTSDTRSVGLAVRDLEVAYGHAGPALRDVSVTVDPGSFVAVLGANGAGKTTLVRAITGLLPLHGGRVTRGSIEIDGRSTVATSPRDVVRRGICQVPEGRMVFAGLSVEENLRAGAATRRDRASIDEDIRQALERFPALGRRRNGLAGLLSGGEQQMLSIARALLARPGLLVVDELSLGLSPKLVDEVFEMIREVNSRGTGILLIEQNARRALEHAEYAYALSTGRVLAEGQPSALSEGADLSVLYLGGGADGRYRDLADRYRTDHRGAM